MNIFLLLLASSTLDLTISETAGIRRFGYPLHVKLTLPADRAGTEKFRLLDGKKPIAAQFRPTGKREVWLDFNLSMAPLEEKKLRVEYGPEVSAGPEPKEGLTLQEEKGHYLVRSGGMTYSIPTDLTGLLGPVRSGKSEYTSGGGKGLWLINAKDERLSLEGLKGRIQRQGPFAASLVFEGKGATVQVTVPRSKSWVEVEVRAESAKALGADLKLNFASPGLVDFGAGDSVYVALKAKQTAKFEAWTTHRVGTSWRTSIDDAPYVVATPGNSQVRGWAHAMDRTRCTALAIEDFGTLSLATDEIAIGAEGNVRLTRHAKRLRFWLHFVPMPVQIGAVTSPQSMLLAPQVEIPPGR
jgi:hypothetical protein